MFAKLEVSELVFCFKHTVHTHTHTHTCSLSKTHIVFCTVCLSRTKVLCCSAHFSGFGTVGGRRM